MINKWGKIGCVLFFLMGILPLVGYAASSDFDNMSTYGHRLPELSVLEQSLSTLPTLNNPDSQLQKARLYWQLAFASFTQGNFEKMKAYALKTIDLYQPILSGQPDSLEAQAFIGFSHALLGQITDAKQNLSVLKVQNSNDYYTRLLAAVLWMIDTSDKENVQKSVSAFEQLLKDYPQNSDVQMFLVQSYFRIGKTSLAMTQLNQLLANDPNNFWAKNLKHSLDMMSAPASKRAMVTPTSNVGQSQSVKK